MSDSGDIAARGVGHRGRAGRRSIATVALAALVLVVFAGAASAATYTALGDSYSPGVGTRSFYNDGTECKRSPLAYPAKVAADKKLTMTFAACSGANTSDVLINQLGRYQRARGIRSSSSIHGRPSPAMRSAPARSG